MVLADPFPGSNLAIRSISESYRECVRNHACQEGRNFASVQANRHAGKCRILFEVSLMKKLYGECYEYAVCIDLERFFDTVNQSYLIELLSHTIKDGRVISLIHKYLYAGVMVNGVYQPTTEGTPQGGPLSPLLSNIVLNELDKELERRGHPFVRYADDSLIFCKTKRVAIN